MTTPEVMDASDALALLSNIARGVVEGDTEEVRLRLDAATVLVQHYDTIASLAWEFDIPENE